MWPKWRSPTWWRARFWRCWVRGRRTGRPLGTTPALHAYAMALSWALALRDTAAPRRAPRRVHRLRTDAARRVLILVAAAAMVAFSAAYQFRPNATVRSALPG